MYQLDAILAEKETKNEEQYEQLAVKVLVCLILALGLFIVHRYRKLILVESIGNYQPSIRAKAVLYIIIMAEILSDKALQPTGSLLKPWTSVLFVKYF